MNIKIYANGAINKDTENGGWACILSTVLPNGKLYEVEHHGGCANTTIARMEITAVIEAFEHIKGNGHNIEVITNSRYVCNTFNTGWIDTVRENGWKKTTGELPNVELWKHLWELVNAQDSVKFIRVKKKEYSKEHNIYLHKCTDIANMISLSDIIN